MLALRWLICLHFILLFGALKGKVFTRSLRNLRETSTNDNSKDRKVSTSTHQMNRDYPSTDLRQKRYQRIIRSLGNTTVTQNQTELRQNQTANITIKLIIPAVIPKLVLASPVFETVTLAPPFLQLNCEGEVYSCSKKCSNETSFTRYSVFTAGKGTPQKCNCDSACNGVFMDCCGDFAEECSKATLKHEADDAHLHKLSWRCENQLKIFMNVGCVTTRGLWMIARCPRHWQNDIIKRQCHAPSSNLSAQSYRSFLPVMGSVDLLTYRNQYCAQCNNVSTYEFWSLIFTKDAVPPPYYTPEDLVTFIGKNSNYLEGIQPKEGQWLRWCDYPNVISSCLDTSHHAYDGCVNGTVGLVEGEKQIFRNKDCALCNGVKYTCGVAKSRIFPCNVGPTSITRAISLRDYGVSLKTKSCPQNHVYDSRLSKCRQTYELSKLVKGVKDKYQVQLSLLKKQRNLNYGDLQFSLRKPIAQYFKMNQSQITIENVNDAFTEILIIFTLRLSPSQSLTVASNPQFLGTSNDTIGLRRLFKFQEAFELLVGFRNTFTIYRLQVRQVSCIHQQVYEHDEFTILDDLRIRVNATGAVYEQREYYINTTVPNPSATVCLKLLPLQCNGSYIKLNASEYRILPNLTLVYNNSLTYNFGDYIYDNGAVLVCVDFKRNYTISHNKESKDDLALIVLTWFGFIVSIICLLVLFLTYIVFQELRTLPGKNLMSLTISLCLAEILWLCGASSKGDQVACTVIAIANHYFFLVFFTASSVIAYHSCLIFGRKITFRRSKSEDNKTFLVYSFVVWGIPALFVLVFALLDHYNVFLTDYGKSDICWLGTRKAKLFLFIVPFGALLLFNLLLFVFIAVRLHYNQKSSTQVLRSNTARQRQRQNVLVCVKLSTLMAFSWLFGLLQIAVETETDVFAYLFVIFVSFQGLFISIAFLFKRTCYQLYISWLSKSSSSGSGSPNGESLPSNKNNNTDKQDTKL